MKYKISNNLGISILEVIVAILIITMGMVGVLSLVIQNIQAQYINRNILIASGLAQEGLELVRNTRDLNWLKENHDWKRGAGAFTKSDIVQDGDYIIDFYNGITNVNGISNARLYIESINGNNFYTHTVTVVPTNFYRLITAAVVPIDATHDYLDIKCKIRWQEGTENHDYTAETYLYNWR